MDTDVTLATLRSIASRLSGAASEAAGFTPASTPNAGPCTGLLAAAMATYTDTLADLVDAAENSATKVSQSHDSYAETEQRNKEALHKAAGH